MSGHDPIGRPGGRTFLPFLRLLLFLLALPVLPKGLHAAGLPAQTLFGPETFAESQTIVYERSFTVPSAAGSFTLSLVNGDDGGVHRASSAVVRIDGAEVVSSADFNQNVPSLDRALSGLSAGTHSLSVEVRGGEGKQPATNRSDRMPRQNMLLALCAPMA